MVKQMINNLPFKFLFHLGWATLFKPKTKNWDKARAAIEEHIAEEKAEQRVALGLSKQEGL